MFVYAVIKCIPNCTGSFDYAILPSFVLVKKFIEQDIEEDKKSNLSFKYEICKIEVGKLWRKQACEFCVYKDDQLSEWQKETMQDSQKYYERYLDRKAKTTKGVE